jgi:hypothetical protein
MCFEWYRAIRRPGSCAAQLARGRESSAASYLRVMQVILAPWLWGSRTGWNEGLLGPKA